MQHLRHIHSERVSLQQILARFYYHKIPEFRKVQVCERTFDGRHSERHSCRSWRNTDASGITDNSLSQKEHCSSACSKSETDQNRVYHRDTSEKLHQRTYQNGEKKQKKYRQIGEKNRGSKKKPGDHCHISVITRETEVTEQEQNHKGTDQNSEDIP